MLKYLMITALIGCSVFSTGCKKKFEIRDVDPGKAGRVRSLGPESQDVAGVSDQMVRSIIASGLLANREKPPIIHMLPMDNNTRHAFNTEVFSSNLKSQLNQDAKGELLFRSGDVLDEVRAEREAKREGEVDYDPDRRAVTIVGADYFLKGRADGLANVSTKGQSDTIYYFFKLVDAETSIEVWEDSFVTKKEGKDDVIYR